MYLPCSVRRQSNDGSLLSCGSALVGVRLSSGTRKEGVYNRKGKEQQSRIDVTYLHHLDIGELHSGHDNSVRKMSVSKQNLSSLRTPAETSNHSP